ncbi:MAG TPA: hypothetical protein VGN33_08615 [Leifsonia sp.]|jgi:hypothetical protein|nr:hypothetical protein [Leifsonia sp.]
MNAIVIYESVYGNTRAIAEAIADGQVPESPHRASPRCAPGSPTFPTRPALQPPRSTPGSARRRG